MIRFLDTIVCIHHLRGRHPQLSAWWQQYRATDLALPLPVYAELLVGAERSTQPRRALTQIEMLLEAHDVIEITEEHAEHYARIRTELEQRGALIGGNDLWIAAMALANGATLVTANTSEFERVPDLLLEDWTLP